MNYIVSYKSNNYGPFSFKEASEFLKKYGGCIHELRSECKESFSFEEIKTRPGIYRPSNFLNYVVMSDGTRLIHLSMNNNLYNITLSTNF